MENLQARLHQVRLGWPGYYYVIHPWIIAGDRRNCCKRHVILYCRECNDIWTYAICCSTPRFWPGHVGLNLDVVLGLRFCEPYTSEETAAYYAWD